MSKGSECDLLEKRLLEIHDILASYLEVEKAILKLQAQNIS